ncbi:MAG TPA: metallophosphoesterase family protein [Sulfolobales archaeon]|nr:metallophosphoesterase family protein [Sulfolobales archaeon]
MLQSLEKEVIDLVRKPGDVISVLMSFRDLLKEEYVARSKPRGLVEIEPRKHREAVVIGDIHGDLDTLIQLLSYVNIEKILKNNGLLIFLGDYVDRGSKQLETMLFIALLKERYRGDVITLRGNHEPPDFLPVYPHDYPEILRAIYGGEGEEIYRVSRRVFDLLPYAAIYRDTVVFLHGGIPVLSTTSCSDFRCILDADNSEKILEEILWNDPAEDSDIDYMPSPRGAGFLWGEAITREFIKKTGVKIIVRGHEAVWEGYKLNHRAQVLTIFSRKGAPYYNAYAAAYKLDLESFNGFSKEHLVLV